MIPKIIFSEGKKDWVKRPLLSNIDKILDYRGRTPKKLGLSWSDTGYLALSALNVKKGYIDFNADANYGDQELYDRWMGDKHLHKGQVVFTTEAPMGNVAQIPNDDLYILSQRTIAFEVKHDLIREDFLATLLRSPKIFNELTSLSSGGTAKGVSQKSLSNLKVCVPSSLEEQSAIGSLFSNLDGLLASYKDSLANYQALKATMLSKMFPKAGQTVPEIRLDGFEGEWERKNLSEVCNINSGRDYKHLKDGDIPVYGTGGYMLSVNDKLSDEDAIGIGRKGTIDKPYLLSAPFWTVDTLFYVTCKVGYDLYYLFLIFQKVRWKKFDESTGVPSLSKKTIEKVVSKFPSLPEQQAIGAYFSNLDNLIATHQEKITQLETLKKKLLQDMFV